MPTGDDTRPEALDRRLAPRFEPSSALALLDDDTATFAGAEAQAAWDAAWIACVSNSARWAETARRELERAIAAAERDRP